MKQLLLCVLLLLPLVASADESENSLPLTLEFINDGTITITNPNSLTMKYIVNGGEYVATMTMVSGTLTANTPYLDYTGDDHMITFTGGATLNTTGGGGKQCTVSPWTFNGTYAKKTWTELGHDYGFAANNSTATDDPTKEIVAGQFVRIDAGAWSKPMRCYLTYVGSGGGSRRAEEQLPGSIIVRLVGANGETTYLDEHLRMNNEALAGATGWYNLSGSKLSGKPSQKGLYIHNGKIYAIK